MKALLCHSYYVQRGGEDICFEEERDLLVANGVEVVEYVRQNEALNRMSGVAAATKTLWNRSVAGEVAEIVRRERPDVMHCMNSFPLMSPAICHVAHNHGVAVVQSVQNYRLFCANGCFVRDGRPCEDCLGRAIPLAAVRHRCYRDSIGASAVLVGMQLLHRAIGTWRNKVDAFITPTHFARQKFIDGGVPANKVHVKYNSVHPDPGCGEGQGGYIAFAARLTPEKGVQTVLDAWRRDKSLPPLKVVGAGPLEKAVAAAAEGDRRIEWLGHLPMAGVHRIFRDARAVLMPSVWYETFGRTIAEAFACGAPVIASRLGAMAELIEDNRTGLLFAAGNSDELSKNVAAIVSMSLESAHAMREAARSEYERRFTPGHNYDRLVEIYHVALQAVRALRSPQPNAGAEKRLSRLAASECSE